VECFRRAAAGEPQWLESALVHREGRRVELSVAVVPILVHGEILGVYALAEDVTERKRGEEEREMLLLREREARAEAEAANLAKSDFLAVMSHELRTPLNAIIGYTDLVYEGDAGPLNEMQQKHLGRVRVSAGRLLTLIEEILQFARMDPQEDEAVNLEPVDLCEIVCEAAEWIRAAAGDEGLHVEVSVPEAPLVLRTGGGKVRRILTNLLSNAVKFTSRGTIRVVLEEAADAVRISVSDTGIGIPPEHHDRVWEPFWQVQGGNTRTAEGAGLGLSLARRLAHQLGGEMEVRSAPGEGSTFVLRLPPRALA
jgi:signal transduction histidine kinase